MYINLKIWHRLNEQVIQREFEVSSGHRRLNKTHFTHSSPPKDEFTLSALRHFGWSWISLERKLLLQWREAALTAKLPHMHAGVLGVGGGRFVPRADKQVMEVWDLLFESFTSWKPAGGVPHPLRLQASPDSLSRCGLDERAWSVWRCGEKSVWLSLTHNPLLPPWAAAWRAPGFCTWHDEKRLLLK